MKSKIRKLFFRFSLMELYLIGKKHSKKHNILSQAIAKWCKYRMSSRYGCYISLKANISKDCKFIHPTGIVIGEGVTINSKCQIYQCVTIGAARKNDKRYPIIGDNVIVFAGAKILGNIKVEENSIIGANAVVINNVPSYHIAIGVPAKNKLRK